MILRVWSLDRPLTMRIRLNNGGDSLLTTSTGEPHFASIDLSNSLAALHTQSPVTISGFGGNYERTWGMVTITNNETQEVTILTPP